MLRVEWWARNEVLSLFICGYGSLDDHFSSKSANGSRIARPRALDCMSHFIILLKIP